MGYKLLYLLGSIILFLGILWMFLPHAYHALITNENEISHYFHLIQGALAAIIGLLLMIFSNKLGSKSK